MKNICITGFPSAKLSTLTDIMVAAGMQMAKPAQNNTNIDINTWHNDVLSSLDQGSESLKNIDHLGKIWEKLACDIFLANYQAPLWGWVESQSVWLLNFWKDFEPNTYFLLSCIHPQDVLAHYIASSTESINEQIIDKLLDQWLDYHQALLYFYHRNTEKSIIVNINDAISQAPKLLEACKEQWNVNLDDSDNDQQKIRNKTNQKTDVLAEYLAKKYLSNYPKVNTLYDEINATLVQLSDSKGEEEDPLTLAQLSNAYQKLSSLKYAKKEYEENLNIQKQKLEATLKENKHHLDKQKQNLEEKLKESEQENELMLLQLHQVQEELEQLFLKDQEKGKKLQKEIEKNTEHKKQYENLKTQKQKLEATLKENKYHLDKQKQNLEEKLKESEQENELMLLQLHQVQEELEHYFLKYQSQQKTEQALKNRWQRMLDRNPDYCDYQNFELKNIDYTKNNSQLLTWQVTNLDTARREFEQLNFTTKISTKGVSLIFSRENTHTVKPLLRWPLSCKQQIECEVGLLPANNTLAELASSDLDLVKNILNLLLTVLSDESYQLSRNEKDNKALNITALKQVFEQSLQALDNVEDSLHFDTVELKQEQSHPGYDHLWLTLKNLQRGKESWPEFSFRLATANIPEDQFGTHPRLEFPAETAQVLKSWFAESEDEWGEKMELRFAIPDVMDMKMWQHLSENDRKFLKSLLMPLPAILNTLEKTEVNTSQSWSDWQNMVKVMNEIGAIQT